MRIGTTLAVSAVLGILAGCGGETPPAQAPQGDTATTGAKASCGGADHTDKGHCGAKPPTPASSSSAAAPAPPAPK
jgi:hypothetical protein